MKNKINRQGILNILIGFIAWVLFMIKLNAF